MIPATDLQLPDFDAGPRRAAALDVESMTGQRTRRHVLRTVMQAAALVGLTALGVFRGPRRAGAEPPPWREITSRSNPNIAGTCGQYGTTNRPCYTNMCAGTSADLMDSSNCTTTCDQVDALNPYQWHRNRTYGNIEYRDGPGFHCNPFNGPTGYDAWRWNAGNCGFCFPANYRCHDGEKRMVGSANWAFTVCEGLAGCSGQRTSC